MDDGGCRVRVTWVVALVSLLLVVVEAVPARAAFPGANGRLVVQPASGSGLILVGVDGAHPRQICTVARRCDPAKDPVWSPDGSEIAYVSSQRFAGPDVIYPDGSCLACEVPGPWVGSDPAFWDRKVGPGFLPDGRLAVSVEPKSAVGLQLGAMNTDGSGFEPFEGSGPWQQPAWSSTGQLAAVRLVKGKSEVFVIDPATGSARQLTRDGASWPNWSPDGRRLAVVHGGWIELIGSGGGPVRRLTRGGAPAWAPDGKKLAFVGADDRLSVISVQGGTPRPVGHIRALSVDWQPVTRTSPPHCQVPSSASVLAASPDATIMLDRPPGAAAPGLPGLGSLGSMVLGCLTSDGRERLLESSSSSATMAGAPVLGSAVVAGYYAALVNEAGDSRYGFFSATVVVYDLRTGTAVADRGGETASCPTVLGFCRSEVDQLVLGTDGATAAHTFGAAPGSSCASVEQIVANDSTGAHILDSITTTPPSCNGPPPALELSQLTLSGDTLTWNHAGTSETARLN
jgi:hypothetical protein